MASFLPPSMFPRRLGIQDPPLEEMSSAPLIGSFVDPVVSAAPSTSIGMYGGSGPGAMPVVHPRVDTSSQILKGPEIGLSVQDYRQKHGMPALEIGTPPAAAAASVDDKYAAGDAAARARIFSGAGAWKPEDAPWGGDVPLPDGSMGKSGLQQAIDDREHAVIENRRGRSYAEIDASARRPMQDQITSASESALYEDLIPKQRPLYDIGDPAEGGTAGAFHQGEDGTISNRLPAMRLGPERQALIAQAPEMRKQQQLAGIVQGLEKMQLQIENDLKLYAQSGGKQGMSPLDAQKAYERVERMAGLAMEGISGGKDFGSFFKPQDPLQTTMALMMGQKAAQ